MSITPPPYRTNHQHQDIVKHTEILDAYEDHRKSFDGEDDGPLSDANLRMGLIRKVYGILTA